MSALTRDDLLTRSAAIAVETAIASVIATAGSEITTNIVTRAEALRYLAKVTTKKLVGNSTRRVEARVPGFPQT